MGISKLAWSVLKEEEQMAVTLKNVHDKSTWEAGEIMSRSHYKYLEILQRGEYFIHLFTNHFELYGELIPSGVSINPDIKQYLELCINKRLEPNQAVRGVDSESFQVRYIRDKRIINQMNSWKNSKKAPEIVMYNLVLNFDRWNNYRILPLELQEPHAFKRRQKNKQKKQLLKSLSIGPELFDELSKEDLGMNRVPRNKKEVVYGLISKEFKNQEFRIMCFKKRRDVLEKVTQKMIFLFTQPQDAINMKELCESYFFGPDKHRVSEGQKFWAYFRELTPRAVNYFEIQKINPDRKEDIVLARKNMDKGRISSIESGKSGKKYQKRKAEKIIIDNNK